MSFFSNTFLVTLISIITFGAVYYGTSLFDQSISDEEMEKWMSKLPDDKKIVLINIPGSHDSAAFNMMTSVSDKVAQCQSLNITEQLKIGIRKLDLRTAISILGNLICCHGICDCYYVDEEDSRKVLQYKVILSELKNFLENHPTEFIFFSTRSGRGITYNNLERSSKAFEEEIPESMRVKFNKDLTLGDVRGKLVYDFYKTGETDEDGNNIYNLGYEGGSGLDEIHKQYADYNTWKADGDLKVIELKELWGTYDNVTISDAENDFKKNPIKYPLEYSVSCTGESTNVIPQPKAQSEIVNPFISEYNLKKGSYYGWMNMDFATLELAKKFVATNFNEN